MTYIIIDKASGKIRSTNRISNIDVNESYAGFITIIDTSDCKVLVGTDWLFFEEYNKLIENDEQTKNTTT